MSCATPESSIRASPQEALRILAHDVRSPLHTILMAADLLDLRMGSAAEVRRVIEIVRAAVHQIDGIVEDVLVSRVHPWELTDELQVVEAGALLAEAANEFKSMAELRGIMLEVELAPAALYAAIIPGELKRVMANLLSNAIRHTPAGGSVRLAARPIGATVAFMVTDTGAGLDPARLEQLLRKSAEQDTLPGLTGNGLVIVQSIVRAAGGHLSAASQPGAGSTFTVCIPAALPPGQVPPRRVRLPEDLRLPRTEGPWSP
jgi:two-component system, OmpR family, sensor histidine kinase BaeS